MSEEQASDYNLVLGERTPAAGHTDLGSFGRAFIANPDLVARLPTHAPLADAAWRYGYGGTTAGYSDWPAMA